MIAGIVFLIGLVAAAVGGASWIVFGVLVWVGLWLLFSGGRRRKRRRRAARRRWDSVMDQDQMPMPAPMPAPLPPPPQPVVHLNTTRLPAEMEKQVDRIRRKAAVLGQHADRFPLGSKDLYVVQHTESDYLPATVNAYLEVPSWSVDKPTADGRTPAQMLNGQLDRLEQKLDEIAEVVRERRVDNLLANERFLHDAFGPPEPEELKLPR
jgi:hypothetical protein